MSDDNSELADKTEKRTKKNGSTSSFMEKIEGIISKKPARIAVFTHPSPDPDAIGSMMAIEWLFSKACGSEVVLYYDGPISHPQNKALVNLLDPGLRNASEYKAEDYDLNVLVDTIPSYAATAGKEIDFNLIIDHHKDAPDSSYHGIYVNLKAGSCCGTIFEIIRLLDLSFESNQENDQRVATAMTIGIATDTETMVSPDTTRYETSVWSELLEHRNQQILQKVINYEIPTSWVKRIAEATMKAEISEGLGIASMGLLDNSHRDLLAVMSDQLAKWEEVSTAVVFAIIDGERIEGCVRSLNPSVSVADLCKELGGKRGGGGGGKIGKGRYSYSLGGGSLDDDDDDEIVAQFVESFQKKETRRVSRVIKK